MADTERDIAAPPAAPGVRYIGADAWLNGVPARDMDAAEWGALPADVRALALSLGLYEEVQA